MLGRYDEAIRCYTTRLWRGIDPKDEFVREQKSRVLKRLGKQSVVQPTAKVQVWVFN